MWRAVAMVVTLTGCGRLFDLEPPVLDDPLHPRDAGVDGRIADAKNDGATGDVPGVQGCPQTYTTVLGTSTSRYRIVTNMAISWDSAQTQCLNDQIQNATKYTHLVVGASDIELSALDSAVTNEIWTALSDRAIEGSYQWVTNENNNYPPSSGDPWGANEPLLDNNKDCVYMNNNGDLVVQSCSVGKQFVCECDAFMNDPTKYN